MSPNTFTASEKPTRGIGMRLRRWKRSHFELKKDAYLVDFYATQPRSLGMTDMAIHICLNLHVQTYPFKNIKVQSLPQNCA